jgi:hypothetical protein
VEASVTFGVSLGRDADTIGAIAGAIAGAGQGERGVPDRWAARIGPVTGKCLPAVAGRHVLDVADELASALDGARRQGDGQGRVDGGSGRGGSMMGPERAGESAEGL